MNIKLYGQLFSEFVPGILILNGQQRIIWASRYAIKTFDNISLHNERLTEILQADTNDILKLPGIVKLPDGRCFSLKLRQINEESGLYYLVFFDSMQDYNNEKIKLYCLEQIIDSISDGIVMSDYKGKVVVYNKAQEKLEDMDVQDTVGRYLWEAYNYESEDKSEHRQVFKTGEAIINKYEAHSYKNGIPKYVSYSTYPIVKDQVKIGVYSISKNVTKLQSLLSETIELKRRFTQKELCGANDNDKTNGTSFTFSDIVGSSAAMVNLIKEAETIALLDNNILIIGDTGTGKEVFAQSIHNFSKRNVQPFIGINCAAIPENLLESILFGAVKGAYTGAVDHIGLFEEASEGTLFLDELNSMPVSMQTKLLRVLQERKVRRVGGISTIPIHCRVICAINEDPQKLIEDGRLRKDLFYRIAGLCLYIPPLRERKEDILELARFFIKRYGKLMNRKVSGLSRELQDAMLSYAWPGNIRELEHVIENLMVRAGEDKSELTIREMPSYLRETILGSVALKKVSKRSESLPQALREIEKKIIIEGLDRNKWNISETSKDLGIIRQSLIYRIKKLGISKQG